MSSLLRRFFMVPITILLLMNTVLFAQSDLKSFGIGLRGSFYNTSKQNSSVSIRRHLGYSFSNTINVGGCLNVFSRISESSLLEFSIGNIAGIKQELSYIASQKVDVINMTSILLGLRYDFLQSRNRGILQPYLNGGFGIYVFSDAKVAQQIMREHIELSTDVEPGFYLGSGLNIQVVSWIALNFDGKYHFVKIDPNYNHSGFEFGMGINFSWGDFGK